MHISKANRKLVYQSLFRDGALVAIKDTTAKKHIYIPNVTNLEVFMLMRVIIFSHSL